MDEEIEKMENTGETAGKVDLRNVFLDEETDNGVDEYVLLQKKNRRKLRKGEAAVELIKKGLKAEGIE